MSSFDRPGRPERQKRRTFGISWWGNAWVSAVEQLAELDQSRLARGRTYARWNYVGPLTVEPGAVRARVAGSRATPYHTYVKVTVFSNAQWDALLDVVASKVAHAAALIDSELTSDLVDDARDAGIELLPSPGDLTTGCSCPDDANPCKHAAALCFLFADLLDDDPFALLHLRGRTQADVGMALRERRRQTTKAPSNGQTQTTTDEITAREAFATRPTTPLPSIPKAPSHPGMPAPLVGDFPTASGVQTHDLEVLAQATAQRAWEMCTGVGDSGLNDSAYVDLIRRLAPLLDTPEFDTACRNSRRIRSSLEEDARLWVKGGKLALSEATSSWAPDLDALQPAVKHLEESGPVSIDNNRVTSANTARQLRLGQSGQWYEYRLQGRQWHFADLINIP
jgi:uncharacterized Zn finger protein